MESSEANFENDQEGAWCFYFCFLEDGDKENDLQITPSYCGIPVGLGCPAVQRV